MEKVAEKTHAKLGPSGAHRWAVCPGSVVLEAPYPDSTSVYAAWGTGAHEVSELCLWDSIMEEPFAEPLNAESFVGKVFEIDGFRIEVDMEMADCVNEYTAHVHSYLDLAAGDVLMVEQEVPIDHLTGEDGATGTSDVVGFAEQGRELVVIDLKGGQGVTVDAEDNLQLAMYALGAYHLHGTGQPVAKVRMVIIQPRKNHISEWCITLDELLEIGEQVKTAAEKVRAQQPQGLLDLNPGTKTCQWCKAKATCPALRGEIIDTVTLSADAFPDLDAEPEAMPKALAAHIVPSGDLDAEQLAAAMRSIPLLENWAKAVRAEVERRLFDEQDVPGYGLFVGRQGARAWGDKDEAEAALKASRVKAEEMYTKSLISPTQAEKLLAKAKPKVWRKLEELITRSDGKPTVALTAEGGTPYTAHKAQAEDFPDVVGEGDPLLD